MMVAGCTAWLNVAVSGDANATPSVEGAGVSLVTVGQFGTVVNDQLSGVVIATPQMVTAPLTVAV